MRDKVKSFFYKFFEKASQRHNKIFIIPNRYGLYFLSIIFILFLISLSYGHSLAFTTTFVFVSLVMTSAHFTNFNLSGIEVFSLRTPVDFYQGEEASVVVNLRNLSKKTRFDIVISLKHGTRVFQSRPITLRPLENHSVEIPLNNMERGSYQISRVTVSSSFPFGLFYAWKYWYIDSELLVYPPFFGEDLPSFPKPISPRNSSGSQKGKEELGSEEFFGHQDYHEGMPLRSIDWKAYARGKGILLKKFVQESDLHFLFNFSKLSGDREGRLSILTSWLEQAEEVGVMYAVVLDGEKPNFGRGRSFKRNILRKLALFEGKERNFS